MRNPYYEPYWNSSEELEHYGTKGMKWGKKKTKAELRTTQFKDIKVYETGAWLGANIEWDSESKTFKTPTITIRNKAKLNNVKYKLKQIAKTPVTSLNNKIAAFGQKIISSILSKFKNSK